MDSPEKTLDRDRFVSIRSADDDVYKDDRAGLLSPQGSCRTSSASYGRAPNSSIICIGIADNNALSRMVNRTLEVDDKQWAALHFKSAETEDSEEVKSGDNSVHQGIEIPKVPKGSQ